MKITEALLPNETIDDIVETMGYGITYWARGADPETKEALFASPGVVSVFVEDETGEPVALTYDRIRVAFGELLSLEQQHVNARIHGYFIESYRERDADGIDAGFIDSDAADVLAQVAAFGQVVYG